MTMRKAKDWCDVFCFSVVWMGGMLAMEGACVILVIKSIVFLKLNTLGLSLFFFFDCFIVLEQICC
jgi:hypothetical protein